MSKIDDRCVSFVDDVKDMVDKMLSDAELDLSEYECFNKATGRTQLYLSMVKNKYFKI
jgi:hypothetical protein